MNHPGFFAPAARRRVENELNCVWPANILSDNLLSMGIHARWFLGALQLAYLTRYNRPNPAIMLVSPASRSD